MTTPRRRRRSAKLWFAWVAKTSERWIWVERRPRTPPSTTIRCDVKKILCERHRHDRDHLVAMQQAPPGGKPHHQGLNQDQDRHGRRQPPRHESDADDGLLAVLEDEPSAHDRGDMISTGPSRQTLRIWCAAISKYEANSSY